MDCNPLLTAAIAFGENSFGEGLVFSERGFFDEAVVQAFEEAFVERAVSRGDRIESPKAALLDGDEAGFAKVREVTGDGGLRRP